MRRCRRSVVAATAVAVLAACSQSAPSAVDIAGAGPMDGSGNHGCAVLDDGQVRCWGTNTFGQLGDGTLDSSATGGGPVVGIEGATEVAAGDDFSCAALQDGSAACWGYNLTGQIGDGTSDNLRLPTPVLGVAGAVDVAAGADHACAATTLGVSCWGANHSGQLGDATRKPSKGAVAVLGVGPARAVAAGVGFSCALDVRGAAWCWGRNNEGQLGDGTATDRIAPVRVRSIPPAAKELAAGLNAACIVADGQVTCWGGNPTEPSRRTDDPPWPVRRVAGLTGVTAVALGEAVGCATTSDHRLRCWDLRAATPRARTVADLAGSDAPKGLAIVADRPCVAQIKVITCLSRPALGS